MASATSPSLEKLASMRHKSRPPRRRPSFRDELSLVAIRYEKTSQGDAPIPIATVNPVRSASRPASSASAASSSPSSSPVVVSPPRPGSVPPPTEEHPALRQSPVLVPVLPRTTTTDDWKRDSGHAAACSSTTPTINEEECEHDFSPYSPGVTHTNTNTHQAALASPVVQPRDVLQDVAKEDERTKEAIDSKYSSSSSRRVVQTPNQDGQPGPGQLPLGSPTSVTIATSETETKSDAADSSSAPSSLASVQPQLSVFRSGSTSIPNTTHASTVPRPQSVEAGKTPASRKLVKTFSLRSVSSFLSRSDSLPGCQDSPQNSITSGANTLGGGGSTFIFTRSTSESQWSMGSAQATEPLMRGLPAPESTEAVEATASDAAVESAARAADNRDSGPDGPKTASVPRSRMSTGTSPFWKKRPFSRSQSHGRHSDSDDAAFFSPLSLSLPSQGLLDDEFLAGLSFSNRGSVMFGGHRALALDAAIMDTQPPLNTDNPADDAHDSTNNVSPLATPVSESAPRSVSAESSETPDTGYVTPEPIPATAPEPQLEPSQPEPLAQSQSQSQTQHLAPPPDIRVMAAEADRESQKVRSLYAAGDALRWEDGALPSLEEGKPHSPIEEVPGEEDERDPSPARLDPTANISKSVDSSSLRPSSAMRKEIGPAGGYEDWDDLDGAIVDRYGFIMAPPRPASSRLGTPTDMRSLQSSPRRRNVLQKRDPARGPPPLSLRRPPSRKVSARSLYTYHSGMSATSLQSSRSVVRQAGNLLPHNRERRRMDEAGDMLTVSPSLQDMAEEARVEKISEALKHKEIERSEKWRKMAKSVKKGSQGEGMEFEFDIRNPKLIERTWKGVPDRWRTAAWWSFLDVSARNHPEFPSNEEIIASFHRLQERNSPDDVQIDLDVPRTISQHIMFRRRYRGGQRLLFRVLHALSIYFPETGYVQGMASLGATLLCYFDEERCFVMLVRMWQLRGLEDLYRHGFEGLMNGLREFESYWLNKDVAKKLTELGIDATAYGTRWYLTLFNLSIPFPAQLRVWDIFLLLGSKPSDAADTKAPSKKALPGPSTPPTGLDIVHATSAALIQALGEVLLDSDFENAMKTLTSFIPIKDEDLLMKVTKAEWKTRQGKRKA